MPCFEYLNWLLILRNFKLFPFPQSAIIIGKIPTLSITIRINSHEWQVQFKFNAFISVTSLTIVHCTLYRYQVQYN